MPSHRHHRTVDRITQILELAASQPSGMTLTELARALDAPKSSVQGLANGLVATGYLDEHGLRYMLGPGPYIVTLRANRMPARTVGHDDLVALSAATGCSVLLGVRVGTNIVYIDEIEIEGRMQYLARSRGRRPMLETVAGKVYLARMDDDALHEYLSAHPQQDLVTAFVDELPDVRNSGFAVHELSPIRGSAAVGRGVTDRSGHMCASVTLVQKPDYVREHLDRLKDTLGAFTNTWATRSLT